MIHDPMSKLVVWWNKRPDKRSVLEAVGEVVGEVVGKVVGEVVGKSPVEFYERTKFPRLVRFVERDKRRK